MSFVHELENYGKFVDTELVFRPSSFCKNVRRVSKHARINGDKNHDLLEQPNETHSLHECQFLWYFLPRGHDILLLLLLLKQVHRFLLHYYAPLERITVSIHKLQTVVF